MQSWSLSQWTSTLALFRVLGNAPSLKVSTLLQISYISKCNVAMSVQLLKGLTLFRYKPSVLSFFLSSPYSFPSIFLFLSLSCIYSIYLRFLQDHWLSLTYSLYIMFIVNCSFNMSRNKIVYPLNSFYILLKLNLYEKWVYKEVESHRIGLLYESL